MKNKFSDLHDHLFAQLERLSDDDLSSAQIETEVKRSAAMVAVADQLIRNGTLQLGVARLVADQGKDPMSRLPQLEGRQRAIEHKQ